LEVRVEERVEVRVEELYWYKSTNTDAKGADTRRRNVHWRCGWRSEWRSGWVLNLLRFTGVKVQILTQKALRGKGASGGADTRVLNLLSFT